VILGLDIGGANTKAASSDGRFTYSAYLPLWRGVDLEGMLGDIRQRAGAVDAIGVTITGELADCYASKNEGIGHITAAVKRIFPEAVFYGSDGRFHPYGDDHRLLSAANWSASARHIGTIHKNILFIDVGSTTSDVIPVVDSVPEAGLTDFERLSRGELVYAGALRTNVAALLRTVTLGDRTVRTSSELFAITADVNLLLGHIGGEDYTCDAPDGGGKGLDGAARRLARVVCCDLEELPMDDVMEVARQAYRRQVDDLKEGIGLVAGRYGLGRAIVCGSGDFIAVDALREIGMPFSKVAGVFGERVSRVFPAYAVARLLSIKE